MLNSITKRLRHLDSLIKSKATGTPKELAHKLGISERAWYKLRDQLISECEVPIAYCKINRTYYYIDVGSFIIGFQKMSESKRENISAGGIPVTIDNLGEGLKEIWLQNNIGPILQFHL